MSSRMSWVDMLDPGRARRLAKITGVRLALPVVVLGGTTPLGVLASFVPALAGAPPRVAVGPRHGRARARRRVGVRPHAVAAQGRGSFPAPSPIRPKRAPKSRQRQN